MTAQPIVPGDLFARAQTIAGLRTLADFLETNPAVPVREYGAEYTVFPRADDDPTERAEIDRIAAALGETVTDDTGRGGHYRVSKTFGRITYSAVHVSARQQAAHQAHMSYAPAFHIGDTAAA
ncbi:hypothetical protein GCM10027176_36430 [Actinoallomurus bryophytorum]|uniref:Uncharacterized protein n=1 Tax=Actinoallomurus bryophytorum TaxID=1490222 RepID=A0A543CIP4_9ACTN|nr:hypothetical protein [Actinoallomurus bryophytorum]TQL96974.1 hypothetical protein FB559_2529 [Actinoallomurus bryophytorum]